MKLRRRKNGEIKEDQKNEKLEVEEWWWERKDKRNERMKVKKRIEWMKENWEKD